ncbi:Cryptic protein, partial [Chelonia mydas]
TINETNGFSELQSRVPFIGLTDSKKLNRHCCKNGGTCILGSFCACPKHFTGRYCDFDERKRDCGAVLHGNWLQKDCSLCKCVYGTLHCIPQMFQDGCGREKEEHKSDGENVHATAQKQQPKNQGTTLNMFNDMNRSDESSKQQSSRTFVPFTGLTDSSNCGSVAHGVWVQKGCRFCRCGYGILHCLSEITQDNCGFHKNVIRKFSLGHNDWKMNSQYVRFEVFGCETEELTDFWEKTIEKQTKHLQIEKERQQKSALPNHAAARAALWPATPVGQRSGVAGSGMSQPECIPVSQGDALLNNQSIFLFRGCEGQNCDDNPDQKNPNTSLTTFNDINNLNSERRRRNPSEVLPFTGLTDGNPLPLAVDKKLTEEFFH